LTTGVRTGSVAARAGHPARPRPCVASGRPAAVGRRRPRLAPV